jgi:hypothetical protein
MTSGSAVVSIIRPTLHVVQIKQAMNTALRKFWDAEENEGDKVDEELEMAWSQEKEDL